jgi:hypothetical protein
MGQTFFSNRQDAIIFFSGYALQGLLSSGFGFSFPDQLTKKSILIANTMADNLGLIDEVEEMTDVNLDHADNANIN